MPFADHSLNRIMRLWCAALLLATPTVTLASDPDLTAMAPADALLYAGWAGRAHTRTAGADTAGGRLLAEPQMRDFVDSVWRELDDVLRTRAFADRPELYPPLRALVQRLWTHPSALIVLGVKPTPMMPVVEAAVVCRVGDYHPTLLDDVAALVAAAGLPKPDALEIDGTTVYRVAAPLPGGVFYARYDGLFVIAVGPETIRNVRSADNRLASAPALAAARQRIGGTPAQRSVTAHANLAAIIEAVRRVVPDADQGEFDDFVKMSGYDDIATLTLESFHDRGGYRTATWTRFRKTPPTSAALIATLGAAVTDSDLRWIPRDVHWAWAGHCGTARPADALLDMLPPEMTGALLDAFKQHTGVDLKADVLDQLGQDLILFDAPANGGLLFTGTCAVLRPVDVPRLTGSIGRLVAALDQAAGPSMEGRVQRRTYRGHTVEFINLVGLPIPIAPAWCAHEGQLIVGLFPQVVYNALDRLTAGNTTESSLLANADFQRARTILSGQGSQVFYSDTRGGFAALYALLLPALQAGLAMAQSQGFDVAIDQFPALPVFTRHLFGDIGVTTHDAEGILMQTHGPLPIPLPGGSAAGVTGIAIVALLVSIMLPSLARARAMARQSVHMSNLRQIGLACHVLAADNARLPLALDDLVTSGHLDRTVLDGPDTPPGSAVYVWVAGGLDLGEAGADTILAHLDPQYCEGERVPALFSDGSARTMPIDELNAALHQQRTQSGQ